MKITSKDYFEDQEAYYVIECKRLNNTNTSGSSGLNSEYIQNGIHRFTSKKYSSYYSVNGMIGFIVEDLNIEENTERINTLLLGSMNEINTIQQLTKSSHIKNFAYQYISQHTDIDKSEIKIYHLMFDFKDNIQLVN